MEKPKMITNEEIKQIIHDAIFDAICDKACNFAMWEIYPYGNWDEDPDEYYENIEKETQKYLDNLKNL